MKLEIIVVRDIKANCFATPQFVATTGHAIRSFGDEINREDQQNVLFNHPEDFELYHVGSYHDEKATFDLFNDGPKQLAVGSNLKR